VSKSGVDSLKMVEWTCMMQIALASPSTSRTHVNAEWTANKSELNVTDFAVVLRWKWLFMNGCQCKSLIGMEFLTHDEIGKMLYCAWRL
jgi:hypothetical protein